MATSRVAVQTEVSIGMADGATNTYIRKQIQRLRLSKGWTQHDLEQAAGMAANSLEGLEAGVRRINVDTLRKIVEALDAEIMDVWPPPDRINSVQSPLPFWRAVDPINFSRLAEVHSLTGAEASCMFMSNGYRGLTHTGADETPAPALRVLSAINMDDEESERLSRMLLEETVAPLWVAYLHCENGRSLYLCLKNAHVAAWAEEFIERCLSAWLTALPC